MTWIIRKGKYHQLSVINIPCLHHMPLQYIDDFIGTGHLIKYCPDYSRIENFPNDVLVLCNQYKLFQNVWSHLLRRYLLQIYMCIFDIVGKHFIIHVKNACFCQ